MGTEVLPYFVHENWEMPIKRILRVSVYGCSCCCCFIERSNCFDSVKEAEWSMDAVRKQIYMCSHWGSGQHLWDPSTYFKLEPAWILSHKYQNNLKVCWDNVVYSTLENENTSCGRSSFLCNGEIWLSCFSNQSFSLFEGRKHHHSNVDTNSSDM